MRDRPCDNSDRSERTGRPARPVVVVASLILTWVTVGCGDGNGQTRFTPERPGTLTVATNLPAPGWWNGESAAALTGGFEYGMASEIARRLGLTGGVLVINVPFDDLVAGHVGKYDIGLSQVTITPERAKVVDFSAPYFNSHAGVLVSKGTAVPDLSAAKRLRWGVMAATTMETFLDEQVKPDVPVRLYPDQSQTVAALRNGEVDALLLDTFSALVEATQSAGTFEVPAQFRTGESFGAVLPKGSKNRPEVDRVIKALADDGTLGRLSDQFLEPQFGTDPAGIRFIEVPLR